MAAKKIVAFLVEGPTEIEFYKAVVQTIRDKMGTPFDCKFEWIDMHGIGNYKLAAQRKFRALKRKHEKDDVYAMLCIDTDVFKLGKKPPINKETVKRVLESEGAKEVHYIEAEQCIEDWFLSDFEGVASFLGLPKSSKPPRGHGAETLAKLFMDSNRMYIKGSRTNNFINALNIGLIIKEHCNALKVFCQIVGVDCNKICNKE